MSHRILLTGTEGWAVDQIDHALRRAGHKVRLCHELGDPSFPCVGLKGGVCPLDDGVEVVLTVRAHPLPQPTRREDAVTCGLRARLPLVVAGSTILNPFAAYASAVVEGLDSDQIGEALASAISPTPQASFSPCRGVGRENSTHTGVRNE